MDPNNAIQIESVESLPVYLSDSSSITTLSGKKLKEIGNKCRTRLETLKTERAQSKWEQDKEADFNSYHLVPPARPLPYAGYPNLACPLPRIGVDTFHANVLYTFAGQDGKFNVLPDFLSKSHMDVAERAAKYMTYVANYESGLYDALDKADLDAQKYKTGYLKPVYIKEQVWETREVTVEETVPDIDEMTGEVTAKKVSRRKRERIKRTVFDGVKVCRISPECIFASHHMESVEDAVKKDFLFEVQSHNYRYIEELSKPVDKDVDPFFAPAQVKKIKDIISSNIISNFERAKQAYDGYAVECAVELTPVELAEAHYHEDINDDGLAEKISVIFETSTGIVLRVSFAKCRIVKLTPRPIDGRWDGESIRQATQSLILEWEAIHNQRVAKGQWSNLPFFFYKAGGRFNPQTLTLMPGRGYPVDDPSSVAFPQIPSPDMSYYQEERLLLDYIDRVLALGDAIQGVVSKSGDSTATETINAQQRAGIRLSNPMNRIAGALSELMGHIWELNKECAPEIKEFKVTGMGDGTPVFDKITNRDYDVMVSFKIRMATLYDVQMVRDTALLNYRTFISNPMVMNNPASFYELTVNTMKAVGLHINVPKPEQAKVKSPWIEHDIIRMGEDVDPVLGEDLDEHLKSHEAFMKSEEFKDWPIDAQMRLTLHRDKTMMQKQALQMGGLNQSGIYEPPPAMAGTPQMPSMTASRNPSQVFNNLRVGETSKSQMKQPSNGAKGAGY